MQKAAVRMASEQYGKKAAVSDGGGRRFAGEETQDEEEDSEDEADAEIDITARRREGEPERREKQKRQAEAQERSRKSGEVWVSDFAMFLWEKARGARLFRDSSRFRVWLGEPLPVSSRFVDAAPQLTSLRSLFVRAH